ncbi:MAG: 1-deoxy-D-xylulose-5-phosphate synthase [Thermoleophilia bacterium]|nr:1-deoxy-D-xylulose-5-phosphate synthase [Thermoleophilia bacterium]
MRNEFIEELTELAAVDDRVMLLTGDLGFTVLEDFAERHPDRFLNAGVAEQNMTGMATGLAEAGFVPFTYSIATFAALRPFEFIRNGAALHRLPVRVVGVGGGFDYGQNGITHFALEDIGIMRMQPAVTVVAPSDADQARAAVNATADVEGPIYFRIGKVGAPIPGLDGRFQLGRAALIGAGTDVAIVAIGSAARAAVDTADLLADHGISATVAVVSTFNPAPDEDVADLLARVPLAVTIETHYLSGGLGSWVSELVAERNLNCRVIRRGVDATPHGLSGSQQFLERHFGLTATQVADTVKTALDSAVAAV